MTKKLWAGRFKKALNPIVENFTESLSFDRRLFQYDITGSIAHVRMLARSKIIRKSDANKIIRALSAVKNITPPARGEEDIHMYTEKLLIKKIGDTAKFMHTGRSRNDQVQVDTRMYMKDEVHNIVTLLTGVQKAFINLAENNSDIILPGFTHLQHAQPVLLAHHLLAYVNMFQRDKERLADLLRRIDVLPLGSGALAGSNLPLDREFLAKSLGFSAVSDNSMDSVSDRDYIIELLSDVSIIGMHLSRLAEELVLWSTKEFDFVDIDESLCTGSSLMPQKKNPDPAELLRAKTGRLYGNLVNTLTVLKGLPLTYNRDLQEDKPPLFDSVETIKGSLKITVELIKGTKINKSRILEVLEQDDSYLATDLVDYLVTKGVPFRQAHHDVGRLSALCQNRNIRLKDLTIAEYKTFNKNFGTDTKGNLNAKRSVLLKKTIGSTNPKMVRNNIKKWKKLLNHSVS